MNDRTSLPSAGLLVFDLDGVITSEQIYLETARCTIQEIVESDDYFGVADYFGSGVSASKQFHPVAAIIPSRFVTALKTRAVNSNWDLCYLCACLYIVDILHAIKNMDGIDLLDRDASLEQILRTAHNAALPVGVTALQGEQAVLAFLSTLDAEGSVSPLDAISAFIDLRLGTRLTCLEPKSRFRTLCYEIFQEWIHGCRESHYANSMPPIGFKEETVVDASQLAITLQHLRERGYVLGIATGRPRREAMIPLEQAGLLSYFAPKRIITYDDVQEAEDFLTSQGTPLKLSKPHPFVIRKAISPHAPLSELTASEAVTFASDASTRSSTIMIGDSTADILAAKRAGCASIGVLTGLGWEDANLETKRRLLTLSGCDVVIRDVLELPTALEFYEKASKA